MVGMAIFPTDEGSDAGESQEPCENQAIADWELFTPITDTRSVSTCRGSIVRDIRTLSVLSNELPVY
jgi:hypothetical protein